MAEERKNSGILYLYVWVVSGPLLLLASRTHVNHGDVQCIARLLSSAAVCDTKLNVQTCAS